MEEYLSIGKQLYHKYLGNVTIISIGKDCIKADTGSRGVLGFAYYDFGKVLFLEKEHTIQSFHSKTEYISFCKEDKRIKLELEEKATQEHEKSRIKKMQETEKELERKRLFEKKNIQEIDLKAKLIENLKNKYQFEGFHHYTDIKNLYKIIQTGKLFSRNKAFKLGFTDAADPKVLSRTNISIKDYVRFFYKGKTPTTYNNEGIKLNNTAPHMPIPVLLLFDEGIIKHPGVAYLSGGGGNSNSLDTKDISRALNFDWDGIFHRGPISKLGNDTSGAAITNKKNAEFLYPFEVDIKYIKRIIFRAPADKKTAERILGVNSLFSVDNDESKFHCEHDFLYDYDIIPKGKDFLIALKFYRGTDEYAHDIRLYYHDKIEETLNINKLSPSRKTDLDKPIDYINRDYYFVLHTLQNKRVVRIVKSILVCKFLGYHFVVNHPA